MRSILRRGRRTRSGAVGAGPRPSATVDRRVDPVPGAGSPGGARMDDTLNQPTVERGPWPTTLAAVVALLPLVVGTAAGILADRRQAVGPIDPNQLVFWVVIPLGALYPTIAAV